MTDVTERYPGTQEPFGAWLLKQDARGGLIGNLARALKVDRTFPKAGDPEVVRKFLGDRRASGDDWEAFEDAELEWRRD
jgi:hypothetical protein